MALKDIKIRPLTDDDMVEVTGWFAERKWKAPPRGGMLPESGFVAELDGRLLSVAWLYVTNSSIAIVDWIATNPKAGTKGLISVKTLLRYIEEIAADAKTFMTFIPNDKFARYLKNKCGFTVTEKANICVRNRPMEA